MHKCEKVQKHPGCFFFVAQEVEKSNYNMWIWKG